jgi:hypothetical protein
MFNYQQIFQNFFKNLPPRIGNVLERRFGLKTGSKETLEAIGNDYGLTRERIRQIEEDGLKRLKEKELKKLEGVFQYFLDEFRSQGNLKKEDLLLNKLGGSKFQNHIFFLLNLEDSFKRHKETKNFYPFWTINENSVKKAQRTINQFIKEFKTKNQPLDPSQYLGEGKLSESIPSSQALFSYLEISKYISKGPEGLYGLREWPEINPRGIKDKIYLILKREKKPLHFKETARLINWLPQTVHNELIRDPRFVLVGRGIYGLKEWGYSPGPVLDVICQVLREAKRPLSKEEVIKRVLSQRMVKENTILLNLSNKDYFLKNSQGKYVIKKS